MNRVVISLLLASSAVLLAQSSSLQGTVSDQQGAAVPDAVVSITNQETAVSRRGLSSATGTYSFPQIPPGNYRLEVQKPGFKASAQQVRLQINTPATIDLKLEIGQVSESINVLAETPAVNTQNASVGNPFTELQIRQLPLLTRNVVDLLSLQPGVTPTGEVAGAKRDQNNVTLDGVDVNDPQGASSGFSSVLPVPLDSVQEFRTTVAGVGADQGRSSGGQVSLVTKSGSNAFHGSLYEFHRNVKTAANNWFSNRAGIARENLIRNQYGASLGGRIIKDRVFFFANWEDRKDATAVGVNRIVPSETYKQGIVQFRMSNGAIGQLTPAQIRQVDPLGVGINQTVLDIFKKYPAGNDPSSSADRGLNFSIFRFNAPKKLNYRTYVLKNDFNIDKAGRHTLSLRGTMADNAEDDVLAQFPGLASQAQRVDQSKGFSARYTTVVTPALVNTFNYGYTRLKNTVTGAGGPALSFYFDNPTTSFPRALNRIAPVHNFVDDATWTKGRHTVQFGVNFRLNTNDRASFATAYPSYSFSRNTLAGLGADMTDAINAFIKPLYGDNNLRLTENTPVQNAMGALFGIVNNYSGTYNFGRDGKAIPFGQPIPRVFGSNEYEFYAQDTFKLKRSLTLTLGLRYGIYTNPYEKNGVQVNPTQPLDQYFANRAGGQALGIPSFANPLASLTYDLSGPVNGKSGYYGRDTNNFAPRLSVAWAPEGDNLMTTIFGKGSVVRAGAGVLFDRYGNQMAVTFAQSGSPGLATQVTQPVNTNFTTSTRYNGSNLPALPAAPSGGMPFTPPTIVGGFTSFSGVNPSLVAPYSIPLNLSYTRPLPKNLVVEIGYVGRLSRKGLLRQDYSQPLTNFRDPKSGQTWTQASGVLYDLFLKGVTPAQVRANPSLVGQVPFFENMFPGAANLGFAGSATANYFNTVYGTYAGSDLDALNDMDRLRRSNGRCISVFGCNTFFANQSAGMTVWTNASNASYHAGNLVVRRPLEKGWGFDFNYTLSHAFDIASGNESGIGNATSGAGGSVIQDAFNPKGAYGVASFDIRHNATMNTVVELPFGKGKKFLHSANPWVDQAIGGWQVSMLGRFRSGLPQDITNGGVYPTNYLNSALAVRKPGAPAPVQGVTFNQNGNPSIFQNTSVISSYQGQYPGTTGERGIVRAAGSTNFDISVGKRFKMPFEGHTLQFRAEAFNAFNTVNFTTLSLNLTQPANFGQFTAAADARVMQFALRYEF
ncbi:MAG: TonB-dependent receptor [Acidobacteria bacterium]|nr:TonB-dependent receptor [Acidobacteriota bacterium]